MLGKQQLAMLGKQQLVMLEKWIQSLCAGEEHLQATSRQPVTLRQVL